MTKLETVATAATWVLMNALAVLVALDPLPSDSQAPLEVAAVAAGQPTIAQA